MEPTVLELRNVTKAFADASGRAEFTAVDCVSLSIARGSFFSLLGPSGCGKTTTLRMIAGFETPDEGEILLGGARIDGLQIGRAHV